VGVESPLELSIDRDDVDIEDAAVAVEHVVEVIRDVVHDPEHPSARSLRDPDICGVENTEHICREGLTDRVCEEHLDDEYAALCRTLTVRLARKRPSPLDRGEPRIWAAGVVYTVGSINFLFDKSEPPHLRADKLAERVEVVQSTMANKSARIRSVLGLSWYEPELTRRGILEQNPFAWTVTVNGIPFDARTLPDEIQEEARRLGLIPDLDSRRAA
jgi:hypothetical protein